MPESYSIVEVARIMKISEYSVRKMARENKKKHFFKFGREWRIMESDLNKWIEELKQQSYSEVGS